MTEINMATRRLTVVSGDVTSGVKTNSQRAPAGCRLQHWLHAACSALNRILKKKGGNCDALQLDATQRRELSQIWGCHNPL